jgi:hypothetical protein
MRAAADAAAGYYQSSKACVSSVLLEIQNVFDVLPLRLTSSGEFFPTPAEGKRCTTIQLHLGSRTYIVSA